MPCLIILLLLIFKVIYSWTDKFRTPFRGHWNMEGAEPLSNCCIFAGNGFGGYLLTLSLQNKQTDTISWWNVTGAFVSPNGTTLPFLTNSNDAGKILWHLFCSRSANSCLMQNSSTYKIKKGFLSQKAN